MSLPPQQLPVYYFVFLCKICVTQMLRQIVGCRCGRVVAEGGVKRQQCARVANCTTEPRLRTLSTFQFQPFTHKHKLLHTLLPLPLPLPLHSPHTHISHSKCTKCSGIMTLLYICPAVFIWRIAIAFRCGKQIFTRKARKISESLRVFL